MSSLHCSYKVHPINLFFLFFFLNIFSQKGLFFHTMQKNIVRVISETKPLRIFFPKHRMQIYKIKMHCIVMHSDDGGIYPSISIAMLYVACRYLRWAAFFFFFHFNHSPNVNSWETEMFSFEEKIHFLNFNFSANNSTTDF